MMAKLTEPKESMSICVTHAVDTFNNAQMTAARKEQLRPMIWSLTQYWTDLKDERDKFAELIRRGEEGAAIATLLSMHQLFYFECLTSSGERLEYTDHSDRNTRVLGIPKELYLIGPLLFWIKSLLFGD